nr:energy-coupling factor transporter transmembrane protein EcfT [Janibacter alkaliphilus]
MHRTPAGVKVGALVLISIGALLVDSPWIAAGLLLASLAVLLSARVDLRLLRRPLVVLLLLGLSLALFMWWQQGAGAAVVAVSRLLTLALLAWTVSMTTRVSDMLSVLLRVLAPLRRVGVDPARVGMTIALAVRSVPLLLATVSTAQQARQARGQGRSLTALGVPVVVRSARIADELGDALVARGYDPDED